MKNLLIVNDNILTPCNHGYEYKCSKFHLFLHGFNEFDISLSGPLSKGTPTVDSTYVEGIKVLLRPGYGITSRFYAQLPYHFIKQYHFLRRHVDRADIVMIVLPACTAPITYWITKKLKKPSIFYIVGDVEDVVAKNTIRNGFSRQVAMLAARWEFWFTRKVVATHPAFVLGKQMRNKLQNCGDSIFPAMTSLVSEEYVQIPYAKKMQGMIKLLSVGRISNEKGLENALTAVSKLLNKGFLLQYYIVGDGPDYMRIEALVRSMLLGEQVVFTGWLDQDEIRKLYNTADIFLMPSLSEGIPKVILDSMAAAVPVIATSVGGIPELIGANENGWLVKPGDPDDLARAIKECINNDAIRMEKLNNAYQYILDHTMNAEAGRIQAKLNELLDHAEQSNSVTV